MGPWHTVPALLKCASRCQQHSTSTGPAAESYPGRSPPSHAQPAAAPSSPSPCPSRPPTATAPPLASCSQHSRARRRWRTRAWGSIVWAAASGDRGARLECTSLSSPLGLGLCLLGCRWVQRRLAWLQFPSAGLQPARQVHPSCRRPHACLPAAMQGGVFVPVPLSSAFPALTAPAAAALPPGG